MACHLIPYCCALLLNWHLLSTLNEQPAVGNTPAVVVQFAVTLKLALYIDNPSENHQAAFFLPDSRFTCE